VPHIYKSVRETPVRERGDVGFTPGV